MFYLINVFIIISRGEYKNWTFWLVEKLVIWCHIVHDHPVTNKLTILAISASKNGKQLLNEVSKDITLAKSRIDETMENFQNYCCNPWTKNIFKNSYSRLLGL